MKEEGWRVEESICADMFSKGRDGMRGVVSPLFLSLIFFIVGRDEMTNGFIDFRKIIPYVNFTKNHHILRYLVKVNLFKFIVG